MRLIAFGDIHMNWAAAGEIHALAAADHVLLNGDLTNFGGRREASEVIAQLRRYNPNIYAQFGNLDRPEVDRYLDEISINLHRRVRRLTQGVVLLGLGGSNPTPFNTPSEFSEEQLEAFGRSLFQQAASLSAPTAANTANTVIEQTKQMKTAPQQLCRILLSHAPPYGTSVDRLRSGRHVGSKAVRRLIERYQPDCCISGHIHESRGTDNIGTTIVCNPGPLLGGGWVTITVTEAVTEEPPNYRMDITLS